MVPDTEIWTPEFFWIPRQNVRVGLQFNLYAKYRGGSSFYDGNGAVRNASDNNNTYVYLWAAF